MLQLFRFVSLSSVVVAQLLAPAQHNPSLLPTGSSAEWVRVPSATVCVQVTQASPAKTTWIERTTTRIKDNPWISGLVALGTGLLALKKYWDEFKDLVIPLAKRRETARTKSAGLHLEFTPNDLLNALRE